MGKIKVSDLGFYSVDYDCELLGDPQKSEKIYLETNGIFLFVDGDLEQGVLLSNTNVFQSSQEFELSCSTSPKAKSFQIDLFYQNQKNSLTFSSEQIIDLQSAANTIYQTNLKELKTLASQEYSPENLKTFLEKWQQLKKPGQVSQNQDQLQLIDDAHSLLEAGLNDRSLPTELIEELTEIFYSLSIRYNSPSWSFDPIYNLLIWLNDHPNLEHNSHLVNSLSYCCYALGSADSENDIQKIAALLFENRLKFKGDEKGLCNALRYSKQPEALSVLVEYGKNYIGDNEYAMMAVASTLAEHPDRSFYWDLQSHYANLLSEEYEDTRYGDYLETYLGYSLFKVEILENISKNDIKAIDKIVACLEERQKNFADQMTDSEKENLTDEINDWQKLRRKLYRKFFIRTLIPKMKSDSN